MQIADMRVMSMQYLSMNEIKDQITKVIHRNQELVEFPFLGFI
jgi:hypothetical protein